MKAEDRIREALQRAGWIREANPLASSEMWHLPGAACSIVIVEELRDKTAVNASLVPTGEFAALLTPPGTVDGLRPEVLAFAHLMESTLRQHDAEKGATGWKDCDTGYLMERLEHEVAELEVARGMGGPILEEIAREAADVANISMMLVDVCGGLPDVASLLPRPPASVVPPGTVEETVTISRQSAKALYEHLQYASDENLDQQLLGAVMELGRMFTTLQAQPPAPAMADMRNQTIDEVIAIIEREAAANARLQDALGESEPELAEWGGRNERANMYSGLKQEIERLRGAASAPATVVIPIDVARTVAEGCGYYCGFLAQLKGSPDDTRRFGAAKDAVDEALAAAAGEGEQPAKAPAIPREIGIAVAALKAGLIVREANNNQWGRFIAMQDDAELSGSWSAKGWGETPIAALVAAAEALGLEPLTGETP